MKHRNIPSTPQSPKKAAQQKKAKELNLLLQILRFPIDHPVIFLLICLILVGGTFVLIWNYQTPTTNKAKTNSKPENDKVCKNFDLIAGNVKSAKRIFIGELHNESEKTNKCIDKLTKDKGEHIVLVETVPLGVEAECEIRNVRNKPNRKCIGMDDPTLSMEMHQDGLEDLYTLLLKQFRSYFEQFQFSNSETDTFIAQIKQDISDSLDDLHKIFNPQDYDNGLQPKQYTVQEKNYIETRHTLNTMNEILSLRESGLTYSKIFQLKEKELSRVPLRETYFSIHDEDWAKTSLKRHKSYLVAVQRYRDKFVIGLAGVLHLKDKGGEQGKTAKYLLDELEKDKDQNPYAVLAIQNPYI